MVVSILGKVNTGHQAGCSPIACLRHCCSQGAAAFLASGDSREKAPGTSGSMFTAQSPTTFSPKSDLFFFFLKKKQKPMPFVNPFCNSHFSFLLLSPLLGHPVQCMISSLFFDVSFHSVSDFCAAQGTSLPLDAGL